MARSLASPDDKTSYEEIISAIASWFEGSKAIARTGDKASCSNCYGYFEIPASAQGWAEEGKAYAATSDRMLGRCPDHCVYGSTTQSTCTGTDTLISCNTRQSPVLAQQALTSGTWNCIHFQCGDDDGQLMAGCCYIPRCSRTDVLTPTLPMSTGLLDRTMPNR